MLLRYMYWIFDISIYCYRWWRTVGATCWCATHHDLAMSFALKEKLDKNLVNVAASHLYYNILYCSDTNINEESYISSSPKLYKNVDAC